MPEVVVYTRRGCKLCATAERIAERVAAGRADVVIVDIDADPDLYERYTVRVPVVVVDGREVAELQVHEDELRAALDGRAASAAAATRREDTRHPGRRSGRGAGTGRFPGVLRRLQRRRTPRG